jgi:predicted nucleic acid-binding protein
MVIADTDILVASFRNNEMAKQLIKKYGAELFISLVTEMELYVGAKTPDKKVAMKALLSMHEVVPLNRAIGETALRLLKEYNTRTTNLFLGDAFIAATCIEHNAALLTFNVKDFSFIKGLKLAK